MIPIAQLEPEAAKRKVPFRFANHQQYVADYVRFSSGFTKLSSSGDLERYLAGRDAEVILTVTNMPVAKGQTATERMTMPVAKGSIVLCEAFEEDDPEPYTWYMVSVPADVDALVEEILAEDDRED